MTTEHINTQDSRFKGDLPSNLYHNHYTLAFKYPNHSAEEWRMYLRQNEQFITREISAITEAAARQAIQRLAEGNQTSQDIQAIKQLLDRSETLNKASQDQRTFVRIQYDPSPAPTIPSREDQIYKIISTNTQNTRTLYGNKSQWERDQMNKRHREIGMYENMDGTLHFPDPDKCSELDKAYIRLFNPENYKRTELPEPPIKQEADVQ